jgi:hypothetical protein
MTASKLRGVKIEISCAKVAELRDNDFNIGGLGFGVGSGEWTGMINSRLTHRSGQRTGIFITSEASK